jgi:hypothetical protein
MCGQFELHEKAERHAAGQEAHLLRRPEKQLVDQHPTPSHPSPIARSATQPCAAGKEK